MPAPPHRHIACCVDQSDESRAALARARALATAGGDGAGARLSIVHVAPRPLVFDEGEGTPVPAPESLYARRRRWLHDIAARIPGAEPVLLVRASAEDVCRWAEGARVDLLIVAPHRGPVERLIEGSFTAGIVRDAPCDVLLARPAPATAGDRTDGGAGTG